MKGARRPGICQPSDKILDQICFRKSTGNTGKVLIIPGSLWLELLANHKQRWQSSSGVGRMCLKSSGSRGRDFIRTFFKVMHVHTHFHTKFQGPASSIWSLSWKWLEKSVQC